MAAQPVRHRFTVDEYYRMAEAGILSWNDRVELIEGEIVDMSPIGVRHAQCVDRLTMLLSSISLGKAVVRVQSPIRLDERSEPQPDLTLLRLRDYSHDDRHPGPDDVLLLIEVSDTTLTMDQKAKLPLYARVAIPEVWIVNLQQDRVEVYAQPEGDSYKMVLLAVRGQSIPVPTFTAAHMQVEAILP
jgi:Uma2 family endonuclease